VTAAVGLGLLRAHRARHPGGIRMSSADSHRSTLRPHSLSLRALAVATARLPAACASKASGGDDTCTGEKCDIPDGPDADLCALRRADAFNDNQLAFTEKYLRWPCNDADGG